MSALVWSLQHCYDTVSPRDGHYNTVMILSVVVTAILSKTVSACYDGHCTNVIVTSVIGLVTAIMAVLILVTETSL